MATKPKAIISTQDDALVTPITKASNVLFQDGKTAQDILDDSDTSTITPTISKSNAVTFKVGQGDTSDYSSSAINGVYNSCLLKGRSLVNYITTATRKGVNMTSSYNEATRTWNLTAGSSWSKLGFVIHGKPNTKYFFKCTYCRPFGSSQFYFRNGDNIHSQVSTFTWNVERRYGTFTTDSENNGVFLFTFELVGGDTDTVVEPMIMEYQEGMENWEIPYIDGIGSVKAPVITNLGRNILNVETATYEKAGRFSLEVTPKNTGFTAMKNDCAGTSAVVVIEVPNAIKGRAYQYSANISSTGMRSTTSYYGGNTVYSFNATNNQTGDGSRVVSAVQVYDPSWTKFCIAIGDHGNIAEGANVTLDVTDLCVWEVDGEQLDMPYEPYKSNITSANEGKLELTEDMFEQGGFSPNNATLPTYDQCKTVRTDRLRTKDLLKVDSGGFYLVSRKDGYPLNFTAYFFNGNKRYIDQHVTVNSSSFTVPHEAHYMSIMFSKGNDQTVVPSDFKEDKFQIRRVDKTVVLRSLPNDVYDTLDLHTGEYIQRIGEAVVDGSENWSVNTDLDTDTTSFFYLSNTRKPENWERINNAKGDYVISNRFGQANTSFRNIAKAQQVECVMGGDGSAGMIQFYIKKDRLSSPDVNGFKAWLQANPTTVQYVLETPIVKTVDITGYPFAYENGNVILSSGTVDLSLVPTVEYSLATNRNGQIRGNQRMVEKHQKELDYLQSILLANIIN